MFILGGGWRDVVRTWVGDEIRDTNTDSPSFIEIVFYFLRRIQ